jgi:hypothetical protein
MHELGCRSDCIAIVQRLTWQERAICRRFLFGVDALDRFAADEA